ncbi:hypothetical protein SK128_019655, partial [Halocaridina rubra]
YQMGSRGYKRKWKIQTCLHKYFELQGWTFTEIYRSKGTGEIECRNFKEVSHDV